MPSLLAADALLPSGLGARRRCSNGTMRACYHACRARAPCAGAERAAGPVLPGHAQRALPRFPARDGGPRRIRAAIPPTTSGPGARRCTASSTRLTPDDVEAIARHLYIEMLQHGYTAVAEFHYLHHDRERPPLRRPRGDGPAHHRAPPRDSGIALTLLPVLYAHGGFGHKPLSPAQRRFAQRPRVRDGLLARAGDASTCPTRCCAWASPRTRCARSTRCMLTELRRTPPRALDAHDADPHARLASRRARWPNASRPTARRRSRGCATWSRSTRAGA